MTVTRFRSRFPTDPSVERYLRDGRMTSPGEDARAMIERVAAALAEADARFPDAGQPGAESFAEQLGAALDVQRIVFSTPVMTNAAGRLDRPLAACAVPPVDLRGDLARVKAVVDDYHRAGMGTGFTLDGLDDPVSVLRYLNDVAVAGAVAGGEDRPVGNMAILSLGHPRAGEFIACKLGADVRGLSTTTTCAAQAGRGREFELLTAAAHAAAECADPGLVFTDRLEAGNPTPHVAPYVSTAPCAEVGLAAGETCQFGYLNLGAFHDPAVSGGVPVDLDELREATWLLVRALDDAVEASLPRYPDPASARIMTVKRKIGVGVCGLADLLIAAGLPDDSEEARRLAREVVAFVNYASKTASRGGSSIAV